MKRFVSTLAVFAVLLLSISCAAFATGCGGKGDPVSVQSVSMITGIGSTVSTGRYAGVVVSSNTVKIEKNQELTVSEVYVHVGDSVSVGQALFDYDTEMTELTLNKLKLEIEQLTSLISNQKSRIAELERKVKNSSGSSKLEYTIELQSLQIDCKESEYSLATKKEQIEDLESTVSNASVLSTVDGRVQSINEGGTDADGKPQPFMTIVETGAFRVQGSVNEVNLQNIYTGMEVLVRSRIDDLVWYGYVDTIDIEPEQNSSNEFMYYGGDEYTSSNNYAFYVTLNDTNGLILGQHVYIEQAGADGGGSSALMLPEYYICGIDPSDSDARPYVWGVNAFDKLKKQYVTLGYYDEMSGCYEIIGGLAADDYIAFPDENCREGLPTVRYDESSFAEEGGADGFGEGADVFGADEDLEDNGLTSFYPEGYVELDPDSSSKEEGVG